MENNPEKVIFIQGKSGRGKTVFCQVFANWVKQHLHPLWTPILINLKDIKVLLSRLEDTLKANLDISFIQTDNHWLKNKNTRFIFILDGWDELPLTVRNKHILETFMEQVAEFQQRCQNDEKMQHRVLITSNYIPLSVISNLPTNLEKVEILPFNQQQQITWLEKWQSLPNNQEEKPNLQELLASNKCPAIVKELISEPLLLYWLAGMYRDDQIVIDNLSGHNYRTATALIYESAITWLISKLDHSFYDQSPQLRDTLTQNAVDTVQLNGEFQPSAIHEKNITTPWADFYICSTYQSEYQIKFHSQGLTNFLFAERLKFSLISWTESQETETGKELITTEAEMNWQIYDLLGFGILSKDIVEYLLGLIIEIADFRWIQLYRRLENFYSSWCQSKFIDTAEETLAKINLRSLQNGGIYQLSQRQIDIYAGLNVMILLLSIQRYAQENEVLKEHIIFYPSGQPEGNNFTYQLQNIIHYSNCLDGENFRSLVGQFLSGTHLRGASLLQINLSYAVLTDADLSRASLCGANFSYANLHCAYFIGTDLKEANFTAANLSETYLSAANLSGANLRDANLKDVDLSRANLSGADLRGADCDGANFMGAILSDDIYGDVRWDEKTNWKNTDGLEMAKNVPLALKKRLMTVKD
ncbi:MAG: pentapeptide repeat-containing protein [Cuspidothrix sp.]